MPAKNCAVIGGGINGVMTAWALAQAGYRVELFEKNRLMGATSGASTKLLHGGLRYLETGQFRLVREALQERAWWIEQAPALAQPIRLFLPVYAGWGRPRWQIKVGLCLYDILATGSGFPRHRWHDVDELVSLLPGIRRNGLTGAYSFHDAQMDDSALGLWAAQQACSAGVAIHQATMVSRIRTGGEVCVDSQWMRFDRVVNVTGPWAETLLVASDISSDYRLDAVRGSHILFDEPCAQGCLLQAPQDRRIFFVLPYQGRTLVGTTEVRQQLSMPIECSAGEARYLLDAYNHYFAPHKSESDICDRFAGLRPLISSGPDLGRASREYVIERRGNVLTVFGGKWTTARQLGLAVKKQSGD